MTRTSTGALRAAFDGAVMTLKAPGLVVAVLIITMISAVPFVFFVEQPVMRSLAMQPPVAAISASEIDAEWWQEFSRHAGGLAATFTPAILGFAAPLDSVSALLDGTRPPTALMAPLALSALVWAFLWGGVLHRFAAGETSIGAFISASSHYFVRMVVISATAAVASVILYLTLHALLFNVLYDALVSSVSSERTAFVIRVALYLVFGLVLLFVNAVFSFARVFVVDREPSPIARGWSFVRQRIGSVIGLYAIYIVIFGVLMIGYGALELIGGARVGGWRAIAVGQAFVIARLALRLALGASQVRLSADLS